MNVLIIGHPGSGKTYLADLLSKRTGIEKVDIDVLFDKHPIYAFSKKLYKRALNKLLKDRQSWIIDGYHAGLMPDAVLANVGLTIYLNLPKDELKRNIVTRYKLKKANKEFSHWQSKYFNNLKNYGQIRFQDKVLRKDINRVKNLVRHDARFIELKSRGEIDQFLHSFTAEPKHY